MISTDENLVAIKAAKKAQSKAYYAAMPIEKKRDNVRKRTEKIRELKRLGLYAAKKYNKKYHSSKEYKRAFYLSNKAKIAAEQREYYLKNRAKILVRNKEYGAKNPEMLRKAKRKYYDKNKEVVKLRASAWFAKNPEKRRDSACRHQRKRCSVPRGCIDRRMSNSIFAALRSVRSNKGGRSWERLVGYRVDDLKIHLESLFKIGMSWRLLLDGKIHIDHKIPKSKFTYEKPEDIEFRRCWALENLQPMWAVENLSKGDKIIEPSQIPLGV